MKKIVMQKKHALMLQRPRGLNEMCLNVYATEIEARRQLRIMACRYNADHKPYLAKGLYIYSYTD